MEEVKTSLASIFLVEKGAKKSITMSTRRGTPNAADAAKISRTLLSSSDSSSFVPLRLYS